MKFLWFALGFALCAFIVFLYNVRWIAAARRRRKRQEQEHPEQKTQATKIIVFSIMITYYIAFAVAVWVVVVNPDLCGSLSDFSGMGSQ